MNEKLCVYNKIEINVNSSLRGEKRRKEGRRRRIFSSICLIERKKERKKRRRRRRREEESSLVESFSTVLPIDMLRGPRHTSPHTRRMNYKKGKRTHTSKTCTRLPQTRYCKVAIKRRISCKYIKEGGEIWKGWMKGHDNGNTMD